MQRSILILGAVVAIILSALVGTAVFAQDGSPAVAPSSIWFDLWTILQPLVVLFFSIVGPVLVTWIGARVIALLKITDHAKQLEVEAQLRTALHASAANAVKYAMTKAGLASGIALSPEMIGVAANYVIEKNPDAVRRLSVDEKALREILLSKVPDAVKAVSEPAGA